MSKEEILLQSSLKQYTYGQDKASLPADTITLALSKLQSSTLPILAEIFSLAQYDKIGIPVYTCILNPKLSPQIPAKGTFGKGINQEQAKASALMELVERFSGFSFLKRLDRFLITKYAEVQAKAILLDYLLYPFSSVYRETDTLLALKEVPLSWAKGFDLIEGEEVLLPLHWFHRIYGTTGWAAGNSKEEAILQALCEVIERHCVSTVIEEKLVVPTIDPQTIKGNLAKALIEKITQAGIELIFKDFSLDLGIPTIAVISHDPNPIVPTLKFYAAAGTHLNPEFALIRALTELVQHRAQIIYRETIQKQSGGPTYCFPLFKTKAEVEFLFQGETISFEMLPRFSSPDFKVEIEHLLFLLKQQSFRAYVVETTHKVLGIPAVIVTIPGARLNRPSTKIHPYLFVARQLMDIGQYQRATAFLEKAFMVQPSIKNSPQILCQAAVCYKKAGHYKKAATYFQQALEHAPYLLQSSKFMSDFMEVLKKVQENKSAEKN